MPRHGKTDERGYGRAHQQLRAALLPDAYGRDCPKCGAVMMRGDTLDLGHTDDRSGYTGMEHASCNRRAGAIKRNSGGSGRNNRGDSRERVVNVDARDL